MRRSILRPWRARASLAVVLVILAAALATTASAGQSATRLLAGPSYAPGCGLGTSLLDSLVARAGGARGEGREPALNQAPEEIPLREVELGRGRRLFLSELAQDLHHRHHGVLHPPHRRTE